MDEQALDERMKRIERRLAAVEEHLADLEGGRAVRRFEAAPPAPSPDVARASTRPAGAAVTAPRRAAQRPMDLERRLGGNWLAKAGMLVLVLGFVFFINYAFDRGWVPLGLRIAIGVIAGLALAVLGDVLLARRRYGIYPQVLVGGGAVLVYFSLYAAYAFEEYRAATRFSLELDAMLLGFTALLLTGYAVARNTPVLAAQSVALGAVTSLVSGAWDGFSAAYIVILGAAVAAAAGVRAWPAVVLSAEVAVYATLALHLATGTVGPTAVWWGALASVAVFAASGLGMRHPGREAQVLAALVGAFAFLAGWGVLELAIEDGYASGMRGPITVILGVTALALAALPVAPTGTRVGWAAAGALLVIAWPPIEFDGVDAVLVWTALLAAGVVALFARPVRVVAAATVVVAALALGHLWVVEAPELDDGTLSHGIGLLAFGAVTLASSAAWMALRRAASIEPIGARLHLAATLATPVVYFGAALSDYLITLAWAGEALVVAAAGFLFRQRDLRLAAIALFGLVLGKVFLQDVGGLTVGLRIITFLVVGAVLLFAAFLYARARDR